MKPRVLNIEDLYRLYSTERAHNLTHSSSDGDDGDEKSLVVEIAKKVKTGAQATTANTATAYGLVKDAAKSTIRAGGSAYKEVIQDAATTIKMIRDIFKGDLPVANRLAALFQLAPLVNGDPLSDEDRDIIKTTLDKIWPNTFDGSLVNDAPLIINEVIRPTALILSSKHNIAPYTLAALLYTIAYYECSLSIARLHNSQSGARGIFQYMPSVIKKFEAELGPFVPGDVRSEISYAVNYFGEWLMFLANRFKFTTNGTAPIPSVFTNSRSNEALRSKLSMFPFTGMSNFDVPCLLLVAHRSGFDPKGVGYSTDVIHEILTKRIPSFIKCYVHLNTERPKYDIS